MDNLAKPTTHAPRREEVRQLLAQDLPVREIALRLGISTQRVYHQLRRLRILGELPPREVSA